MRHPRRTLKKAQHDRSRRLITLRKKNKRTVRRILVRAGV